MGQATFWFASPFRDWIGRRTLTLSWEGRATIRDIFLRLAADYPKLRANLPREGLQDEAMNHLVAVILDGDFLSLDSVVPDGAKVDILTPLAGGTAPRFPGRRDQTCGGGPPTRRGHQGLSCLFSAAAQTACAA